MLVLTGERRLSTVAPRYFFKFVDLHSRVVERELASYDPRPS